MYKLWETLDELIPAIELKPILPILNFNLGEAIE